MAFSTYNSYYVFHLFPQWTVDKEKEELIRPYLKSGGGLGYSISEVRRDYPEFRTGFTFGCNGLSDIAAIDDLFDDRLGRFGLLWFPSWQYDIEITQNIGSADKTLNINDVEYSTFFPSAPGTGRHIFLYLKGGSHYEREITSAPTSTTIVIDSAFGVDINTGSILMSCFLYFGRFDIDEIDWGFPVPTVGIVTLYFLEVPHEYPS